MKKRAGVMPCEGQNCESHSRGQLVVVMRNERDTLSYSCDWCGRAPYARPGTGQHAEWLDEMARMEPKAEPEPVKLAPPDGENLRAAVAIAEKATRGMLEKPARRPSGLLID